MDPGLIGRFDRYRKRQQRNRRLGALITALLVGAVMWSALRTLQPKGVPAGPRLPTGTILLGEWHRNSQEAEWFTVATDGSARVDLGVTATCADWFPDGERIFITGDAGIVHGPLRPAVMEPDGTGLRTLAATRDPNLNLGCGAVTGDGRRLILEGWGDADRSRNGLYSVRASDGGDLVRITNGQDSNPHVSPDGTQAVFMRTRAGVIPDGAGAVFVVNMDGSGLRRITPWGYAFLDQHWSPDGGWIVFQKPYGELWLVHPDGSDLHKIPLALPAGSGGSSPAWSPDGQWIVFAVTEGSDSRIYATHPDGSGLQPITSTVGVDETSPDWRP